MFYSLPNGVSNLYYSVAGIVFLSLLFFFLFFLNIYVLERISRAIYKTRIKSGNETQANALELMENARKQAFEIIKEANVKAQDILNRSGNLSSESTNILRAEIEGLHNKHIAFLEDVSKDTVSAYQKVTEDEKNKGVAAIEETVSNVEHITSEALSDLKTEIDTQRKSYEEFFGENMKKEIDDLHTELKEYKDKKIMEINEEAKVILKELCKDILGKTLPPEDHETLIMDSLEEARVMGVFKDE
jgi:hypothetical protein